MVLEYDISETKQRYREIFADGVNFLFGALADLRVKYHCSACDASGEEPDLFSAFHEGCDYRTWQQESIHLLEDRIARQILDKLNKIQAYKDSFKCHMCGVCCRMASSEFTYDQLQTKAANGDSFARQFTSIFLPYASQAAAREKFPEIVDSVLLQVEDPDSVSFYHCPYVGEDNSCTIYGDPRRPDICASYPDTPLTFIYNKCAWKPWKDETHDEALQAHALIELCRDFAEKLKQALI